MSIKKLAKAALKHSVLGICALVELVCDNLGDEAKKDLSSDLPPGKGRTLSGRVETITYKGGRKVGLYSGEPMQ